MAKVDDVLERVAFLVVGKEKGSHGVVGPITGLFYTITREPTPVSRHDLDELLGMTLPPCCGKPLPFDGELKAFFIGTPSQKQVESVPQVIIDAEPLFKPTQKARTRKRIQIPVPDDVIESLFEEAAAMIDEAAPQEEEIQEVIENGNLSNA